MEGIELLTTPLAFQNGPAHLLTGDLVVQDIERWCHRKAQKDGVTPVMAVVYFNTGADAVDYVKIKAHVAARAGVSYWVYEMPVDASTTHVMGQVKKLNKNPRIHGILIQRPLPRQLDEPKIMGYIDPVKNIEEYTKCQVNNIAADALVRLLTRYGLLKSAQQARIQIVGFGNVITKEFIKQMKRQFRYVSASKDFNPSYDASEDESEALQEEVKTPRASIIISELHRGPGFIKSPMVKPEVSVLVDLGFYVTEKGVIGDWWLEELMCWNADLNMGMRRFDLIVKGLMPNKAENTHGSKINIPIKDLFGSRPPPDSPIISAPSSESMSAISNYNDNTAPRTFVDPFAGEDGLEVEDNHEK
ncbi:hypothetical protein FAVG1_08551 [Fusarium avenaceum]|nr:hypothetical protein FAVG1_08551 [Fusarium avenaceum]